jgi:hypothetical protein
VKVKAFEYPEPDGEACLQPTRPSKSKYWKSWGRKTKRPPG